MIPSQLQQELTQELSELKICLAEINKNTHFLQNSDDVDYQKLLAKAMPTDALCVPTAFGWRIIEDDCSANRT